MKYPAFQSLIDTMVSFGYDYEKEILGVENRRKALALTNNTTTLLGLSEHVRTMIYALLSNNRPWEPIAKNTANIDAIFSNYDIDSLKKADPGDLVDKIKSIRCGNRQITKQMNQLKHNIEVLEKIEQENGSIDNYYRNTTLVDVVKNLSLDNGRYKLKMMGIPLVCEYLKGIGVDVIKPDTLLCRILGRLGYAKKIPATAWEAIEICKEIGKEYNLSQPIVDTVLWQYCAKDKFEVCTATPKCCKCKVVNCPSRAQLQYKSTAE